MAVKHCTSTQEPIADMLGNIEKSLAQKILDEFYGGDESRIPTIDYLAPEPKLADPTLLARNHISHTVESTQEGGEKHVYNINGVLPPTGDWLDVLAGPKLGWLQAFLSNVSIQHGDQSIPNPVKRVLAPRHGQRVELSLNKDGSPVSSSLLFLSSSEHRLTLSLLCIAQTRRLWWSLDISTSKRLDISQICFPLFVPSPFSPPSSFFSRSFVFPLLYSICDRSRSLSSSLVLGLSVLSRWILLFFLLPCLLFSCALLLSSRSKN